ncbi:MAG: DUF3127 domain-containing protein [Duncaniella sp.]|nr:DUF3127 domain-containing protein [Duncaniella sp.]
MEIVGKIIAALPEISGVSASSGKAWKKREYVLETMETYPKKVFFNFWGERADQYPLNVGEVVRLSFDINSREYNGRWYVDISGWKAEPADAAQAGVPPTPPVAQSFGPAPQMPGGYSAPAAAPAPPAVDLAPSPTDDLPF